MNIVIINIKEITKNNKTKKIPEQLKPPNAYKYLLPLINS